jgi:voltage-gated potassium channel
MAIRSDDMYQVRNALLFLVAVFVAGTVGYTLIEEWPLLDSAYMTIITLSTVGFRELAPLSGSGKLFTSGLIVVGVGTLAYAATKTTEALLKRGLLHRGRIHMGIRRMHDHVIVCGYGRMGVTVADQLAGRGTPVVVVDDKPDKIAKADERGLHFVAGDATDDDTLHRAGIDRARALATVLNNDADNLFVTLSARTLNPRLVIIARASNEKSAAKMLTAGATRVLNPYNSGGRLMVRQLLHPSVTEFMDAIQDPTAPEVCLEEIQVQTASSLSGMALQDAPLRSDMNVLLVAVRQSGEKLIFNPPRDFVLEAGDTLLALGQPEMLRQLEALADGG